MTEDAKLKQVINKIDSAIGWIYSLGSIVPNSLSAELNPDDDSVLIYLQTPNNLTIPSLLLNDQTYGYILEQDDASNGEEIIVSLAGSFMDATKPEERVDLDPKQLRQDMDYLYNAWYRLTQKNAEINSYYRDTDKMSTADVRENLQSILAVSGLYGADILAQTETQLAQIPDAYLLAIPKEVQRSTDDDEAAGRVVYHMVMEIPNDSYQIGRASCRERV